MDTYGKSEQRRYLEEHHGRRHRPGLERNLHRISGHLIDGHGLGVTKTAVLEQVVEWHRMDYTRIDAEVKASESLVLVGRLRS